jgi:spermidine/putrescine transport system permease protein
MFAHWFKNIDIYALTWRLPVIVWQVLFFLAPLIFMIAMSFFLVKNYRMVEAFEFVNWVKIFSKGYFWNSYGLSLGLAALATLTATCIAFPASYCLAFKLSETARRWAIFFLIIPFFTSYVLMAESGVVNNIIGYLGIGPIKMLNTMFATNIGYLTLTLPLVIILQTLSMASIDKNLIEAAHNLGAGRVRAIVSVIIPAARIGLIIGALFCFILSFGDFVSPYYLGGSNPPTLPILIIDTTKSGQQWPRAAVIASVMMVTLMLVALSAIKIAYKKR